MKTLLASSNLAVAAVVVIFAGSAVAQYTFPNTVTRAGAQWYVSDNINGVVPTQGNPGPGGFGFSDAEFTDPAGGLDAYDGGFVMRINGVLFAPPSGGATMNGNVLNSGTANYAGLSSQAEFWFDQSRPIVRSLYSFSNSSQAPITATFRWEVNLGSDANTTVRGTSSGDAVSDLTDRWLVTTDNNSGDLVNTLVRYGRNAPHAPDSAPYMPGDLAHDLLADQYQVTIAPGQTARLMMYGWLGTITNGLTDGYTTALANAALFNDYDAMTQAGLFAGLSNYGQIINWAVPEPSVTALTLAGLAALLLVRTRRQPRSPA